ncbi:MAG: rhodanese-like domain-containing protein [Bacteroidetes bacterium]|uniref:rhodanese-like domain-containing protein n=1 Tax=Phnomibacter sp. TaxID=2836217 RepID=UPI002FDDC46A|nr:rhodanese-like domain-containing protein [Bacteroidota bacterium]
MQYQQIVQLPDTLFVDVRTAMEFNMYKAEGSINIPMDQIPAQWKSIEGIGQRNIVFFCRSGNRSGQVVSYLKQLGVANIYNGGSVEDVINILVRKSA